MVLLVYAIRGRGGCRVGCCSFLGRHGRPCDTGRLAGAAFAACTAAAVPAAPAPAAAAAPLSALSTALARDLTLLCASLEAGGAKLSAACRRRCRARRGVRGTRADIPLRWLTTILIPIASVSATPLGATALTVSPALTALGSARLAGMLPPAVPVSLPAAARAMSHWSWSDSRRRSGNLRRRLRSFGLAREEFLEPGPNTAIVAAGLHLDRPRGCGGRCGRGM